MPRFIFLCLLFVFAAGCLTTTEFNYKSDAREFSLNRTIENNEK